MSSGQETFGELRARLDEIVVRVRGKDLSLEKSLDLYEEAIGIANKCAELVDRSDYTEHEAAAAADLLEDAGVEVSLSGSTHDITAEEEAPRGDTGAQSRGPAIENPHDGGAEV